MNNLETMGPTELLGLAMNERDWGKESFHTAEVLRRLNAYERLKKREDNAPHGIGCAFIIGHKHIPKDPMTCNCWKSKEPK